MGDPNDDNTNSIWDDAIEKALNGPTDSYTELKDGINSELAELGINGEFQNVESIVMDAQAVERQRQIEAKFELRGEDHVKVIEVGGTPKFICLTTPHGWNRFTTMLGAYYNSGDNQSVTKLLEWVMDFPLIEGHIVSYMQNLAGPENSNPIKSLVPIASCELGSIYNFRPGIADFTKFIADNSFLIDEFIEEVMTLCQRGDSLLNDLQIDATLYNIEHQMGKEFRLKVAKSLNKRRSNLE